jgi:3-oxoacyl-[acyl-carrier protein] reductase
MGTLAPLATRVALVTGVGRRAGIGAAICREIARNGGDVFFGYWRPYDRLTYPENTDGDPAQIANELRELGVRAESLELDLSKPDAAERLFKTAEDSLGTPSVLINNACHDFEVPFAELTAEILDKHYAVNVRAVTLLCREFVKRGQSGTIINITSGQSLGSMGGHKIPYSITKAALEMLAAQLAPELAAVGMHIHSLDPGPTDTGWMTDDLKAGIARQSPAGKLTSPTEIGELIASIVTRERGSSGDLTRAKR